MKYKILFLFISSFLIFSKAHPQEKKSEASLREIVRNQVKWYPLSFKEWENNTRLYSGYSLQLRLEKNKVIELNFSIDTPPMVIQRNGELIRKLNTSILKDNLTEIPDGLHVFPILCEMITVPHTELKNNLEDELEKIIPCIDFFHGENALVQKPILVKIYPPKK